MSRVGVIDTDHTFALHLRPRQTCQERQSGLIQGFHRKGALRQESVQTALVPTLQHKKPVDAFHGPILGDDETAEIALELHESFVKTETKKGA